MKFTSKPLLNYAQRLRRLRLIAVSFLLFLLTCLSILLYLGFGQLKNNLLSEYQQQASTLVSETDRYLFKKRMLTNALPLDAFNYYQQVYNPLTKQSQQVLSPLSRLDLKQPITWQRINGIVGYFQYDADGNFNSPVWPKIISHQFEPDTTLSPKLMAKQQAAIELHQLLSQSKQIQTMLHDGFKKESGLFHVIFDLPEHLIFYRLITLSNQQVMQGYLVNRKPYLFKAFTSELKQQHFASDIQLRLEETNKFNGSDLKPTQLASNTYFSYQKSGQDIVVKQTDTANKSLEQQVIYRTELRKPFNNYTVIVSTDALPMTSAMVYSSIFIVILMFAILSACFGFYRLSVKQLALGEQRVNFVSSVSHELKTPLTSIRMYSQMLKESTLASQAHKQEYYEFIFAESERLTRLINNILQLSSLSNQQQTIKANYVPLTVLADVIRSKTSSIMQKHGFSQNIQIQLEDAESTLVLVEQDAFAQVVINITDNAIKFFDKQYINDTTRQQIDFIFSIDAKDASRLLLTIRDYGDGITAQQESKIFELFYRGSDELSRTTEGTGIGLALVNELVNAQQGQISVARRAPGLAMLISLRCKSN